jgi:hypothetical protein
MPTVNTKAMREHLKEIGDQVAAGAHCILVCDGAGWHQKDGDLAVPDNISLLPHSPESNPRENVWEYPRGNRLCSLVWDSYDAIVASCKAAWDFLINDPQRIRSIGTRQWACVTI